MSTVRQIYLDCWVYRDFNVIFLKHLLLVFKVP